MAAPQRTDMQITTPFFQLFMGLSGYGKTSLLGSYNSIIITPFDTQALRTCYISTFGTHLTRRLEILDRFRFGKEDVWQKKGKVTTRPHDIGGYGLDDLIDDFELTKVESRVKKHRIKAMNRFNKNRIAGERTAKLNIDKRCNKQTHVKRF